MEKNISSELKFIKYIVEEINFNLNNAFSNRDNVPIEFKITKNTTYTEKLMNVALEVIVFPNAKENDYPFSISTKILGMFATDIEEKDKFEANAIAILYPYVRAIVSTFTAQANVPTLILPPINVNKLLKFNGEDK